MKANVKAWQDIFNEKGIIKDEVSLRALNCILYGPVWEIKELTNEIADKMVEEFNKLFPDFRYDHLEIQILKEGEEFKHEILQNR